MKKIYTYYLLLLLGLGVKAQQFPVFTQYNLNPVIINPAYAGTQQTLNLIAAYRNQWIGVDGAPETFTFSAHAPSNKLNIGVGMNFWSDRVGLTQQNGFQTSYSYRIDTKIGTISMGLQIGWIHFRTDFSKSQAGQFDPTFQGKDINEWKFNTGTGVFLYGDRYFVGASAPLLLNSRFTNGSEFGYELREHFFFTGGYVFDLNEKFSIKPFALIKMVGGAPLQADLNLSLYYADRVMAGVQYRTLETFAFIFEFGVSSALTIGYSLDVYTINDFNNVYNSSHEFVINYFLPWEGVERPIFRKF